MNNEEESLLARSRRFEEQALAEVFDRYHQELYRYAWRLLGEEDLAEDCVAETFSRFLQALKNGGGPQSHLRAYLYRVAHNWITDYYRRRPPPALRLGAGMSDEDHLPIRADAALEPPHQAQRRQEQQEARAALMHLTPDQRQVIALRYLQGLEIEEIAEALHKPVGAVKALQHRGIQALQRLFAQEKERTYVEGFTDG